MGDHGGSVNPAWSKARQEAFERGPRELPGGPHEVVGDDGPRWMVAAPVSGVQNPAYRPARPCYLQRFCEHAGQSYFNR